MKMVGPTDMTCLPGTLFLSVFFMLGVLAIVGSYCRWRWLIDPEGQSFWVQMWSQYRLKKVIGRTGLLIYTYIIGGLFVVVAILGFVFIPGC